jgi:hypothetical protein
MSVAGSVVMARHSLKHQTLTGLLHVVFALIDSTRLLVCAQQLVLPRLLAQCRRVLVFIITVVADQIFVVRRWGLRLMTFDCLQASNLFQF